LVWWLGTRHVDFLTPPSDARLEAIRNQTLASLPSSNETKDAISIRMTDPDSDTLSTETTEISESVEIGDLSKPRKIDTYSERAAEGAAKLLLLAKALEAQAAPQRALLAYERVLDLSQASPEQIRDALIGIRRIKPGLPLWNRESAPQYSVVLHLGTGQTYAEILPGIMEKVTKKLSSASSGLVGFSHRINIGRSIQSSDSATPVALWITGENTETASTDVLSFTSEDPATLEDQLLKTIFNLVRSHLAKATSYNPAPEPTVDPSVALSSNITRLLWTEFGKTLNPEKAGQ
jgi:hypothetical protein